MPKKLTQSDFINKCKKINSENYDYSKIIYTSLTNDVIITCNDHGDFVTKASDLLRIKVPCKKCQKQTVYNNFIINSNILHNNKYKYPDLDEFLKTYENKIQIKCPDHGYFEMTYRAHLQGQKCRHCNKKLLKKLIDYHSDNFNFSLIDEKTTYNDNIKVICKKHGIYDTNFWTLKRFTSTAGCKKCKADVNKKNAKNNIISNEEFIKNVNWIHNYKYDYSKTNYIGTKHRIVIICPNHGEFLQRASDHRNGHGCQKCANGTTSNLEQEWLKSLNIDRNYWQKSLLINGSVHRVDAYDPNTNTIYEFLGDFWHGNPKSRYKHSDFHPVCKRNNKKVTFGELYDMTMKRFRTLRDTGYNLIYIWEKDFLDHRNIQRK